VRIIVVGVDVAAWGRSDQPASEPADAVPGIGIDRKGRQASYAGRSLELTRVEFDLLAELWDSPGRVYTRAELVESVWGYVWSGDTETVTVHIRRLRAKIEPGDGEQEPRWIQTVWGVGYRFSP